MPVSLSGNGVLMVPKVIDSTVDCKLLHNSATKDESTFVLLRSKLFGIANRLGISDLKRENMLLVAAELASNNVKHAGGRGMIQIWQQPGPVLDIVSLDYGPGIANLAQAEQDGYSTANTFGKGFGAIRRLSDESYVYTQCKTSSLVTRWSGVVFLARFYITPARDQMLVDKVGLFSRALSDSRHNGDRIYLHKKNDRLRWLHLDGLGHGEQAQIATANLATHVSHGDSIESILAGVDRQLVATRGAVAAVGEIDMTERNLKLLGVGDMHAHIYNQDGMQHVTFAPGILGREHRTVTPLRLKLDKRGVVVTASDGIRRNLDIGNFVGLFNQHPQLIAYILGNIMGRISDDQSICVSSVG
ncbi:MAG: SpoIIE family protein phosphatase [Gallionella sp.]|nr:SpoIIE family protein phosphatase [Gallionella sp.]